MEIYTGEITGTKIEKNLDGENKVRILNVEVTEPDDTQKIQQVLHAGEDDGLVKGSTAVILEISPAYKIVIGIDDGIEPSMGDGEKKVYSQAGGSIKAFINCLKDGNIDINGDDDNAVRFSKMEQAYNDLRTDLNTFILLYNTHTHTGNLGSPTSTTPNVATISTSNMTAAKVNSVRLPLL